MDAWIEERDGRSVAEIFRGSGERAFRRRERDAIAEIASDPRPSVVATGGGAILDPANVRAMRGSGRVIWMRTSAKALSKRLAGDVSRPLLETAATPRERESRLGSILKMREARYRDAAHVILDTDRLTTPQASARLALEGRASRTTAAVPVRTPDGRYDVHVGVGLLDRAGAIVHAACGGSKAFVVTDTTVAKLHGDRLAQSLRAAGYAVEMLALLPGERHKTLAAVQRVWRWLFAHGLDRRSPVVCLGGGVVGDLAGFAAATALRGVPVVQIPTTLVAQVDSSVGGKTGFDVPEGKNLVGAFHSPSAVVADVDLLGTLPARELAAGMGEVVKYGVIADAALFGRLERAGAAILSDRVALAAVVRRCVELKASVVARDPHEKGIRAILNFGHTVGHALEAASGFRMLHGEAVAAGMAVEASFALRRRACAAGERARIVALLEALSLPVSVAVDAKGGAGTGARAAKFIRSDKKRVGGSVRMPILRRIGRVELEQVPVEDLEAFLQHER